MSHYVLFHASLGLSTTSPELQRSGSASSLSLPTSPGHSQHLCNVLSVGTLQPDQLVPGNLTEALLHQFTESHLLDTAFHLENLQQPLHVVALGHGPELFDGIELAAIAGNLYRDKELSNRVDDNRTGVGCCTVVQEVGLIRGVLFSDCLLDLEQEVAELNHVGRGAQLDYLDVAQALAQSSVDCDAESLVVLGVVYWVVLLGPALALEHLGVKGRLIHVNEWPSRCHNVANQLCKDSPLPGMPVLIGDCLPVDSLACAESDFVLLIEAPQCICGDRAVEWWQLEQLDPFYNRVRRPQLKQLLGQQLLLDGCRDTAKMSLSPSDEQAKVLALALEAFNHTADRGSGNVQDPGDLSHGLPFMVEVGN